MDTGTNFNSMKNRKHLNDKSFLITYRFIERSLRALKWDSVKLKMVPKGEVFGNPGPTLEVIRVGNTAEAVGKAFSRFQDTARFQLLSVRQVRRFPIKNLPILFKKTLPRVAPVLLSTYPTTR